MNSRGRRCCTFLDRVRIQFTVITMPDQTSESHLIRLPAIADESLNINDHDFNEF